MLTNPVWIPAKHLQIVNQYLFRVAKGTVRRLMIFMPPQHGKSELTSKIFATWFLGRFPEKRVVVVSYEADFAKSWGRKARDVMLEYGKDLFGLEIVGGTKAAAGGWNIAGHSGGMDTAGVGGPITGKRADLMIIDDPVKNQEDAMSALQRENAYDWYRSVARTRLSPDGRIIIIQTRWHPEDLSGKLLKDAELGVGDDWTVIKIKAFAEEDEEWKDIRGNVIWRRKKGDILWDRYGKKFYKDAEKAMGPVWFSSMYQQSPQVLGGNIFKEAWIKDNWYTPTQLPEDFDTWIQTWDLTTGKTSTSTTQDFVVGQTWAKKGAHYYLIDQIRDRMDFPETIQAITAMSYKYPQAAAKIVEAQNVGVAITELLRDKIEGLIPVFSTDAKENRAYSVLPLFVAGNIHVPVPSEETKWVREYIEELLMFPNAAHDDQVDATVMAIRQLQGTLFSGTSDLRGRGNEEEYNMRHHYCIGWIPARQQAAGVALVYDLDANRVVAYRRLASDRLTTQLDELVIVSDNYGGAFLRVEENAQDDAFYRLAEMRNIYVERIPIKRKEWARYYENVALLLEMKKISMINIPALTAELDSFKSEETMSGNPEYDKFVRAQNTGLRALALCTYDLDAEEIMASENVYWSYHPEFTRTKGGNPWTRPFGYGIRR